MKRICLYDMRAWVVGMLLTVCLTVLCWDHCSMAQAGTDAPPGPSLSEVVLFGVRPISELEPNLFENERRQCVESYRKAVSLQSPLWNWKAPKSAKDALTAKRRNLEEQMIVLLGPVAAGEAAMFTQEVPQFVEWEGMSEGPLEEVRLAEQWLERYPGTSLLSFVQLFMAHRLRAAYECAQREQAKGLRTIAAGRYREHLAAALASDNKLIVCIAKDLETLNYVYLPGFAQP